MTRKDIIVGIDYSPSGDNAARMADHMVSIYEAKLTCLHVFERRIMKDFDSGGETENKIVHAAQEFLQSHLKGLIKSIKPEPMVIVDNPFDGIYKELCESNARILVVGSEALSESGARHRSGLALRLISNSAADVLVVRPTQIGPFSSVVACVNFSWKSLLAARQAIAIARSTGASVEFLQAVPIPLITTTGKLNESSRVPSRDMRALAGGCKKGLEAWIHQALGEEIKDVEIRCTVKTGHDTAEIITDHMNAVKADLAVLGSGGTSIRLLQKGTFSILAVKPPKYTAKPPTQSATCRLAPPLISSKFSTEKNAKLSATTAIEQ